MVDCYISANSQYAYENEKYYKNGAVITNDTGNVVDEITFKSLIKKETSTFIHKSFSNIIVLVGAGASVLCNSGNIDSRFGKTVFMLAKLINTTLKDEDEFFTLQELSNLCKYNIPVEIEGEDGIEGLNRLFNLEDFLSDLLSFERYVSDMDRDKYIKSKNKIFDLIKENTSYEYDNKS